MCCACYELTRCGLFAAVIPVAPAGCRHAAGAARPGALPKNCLRCHGANGKKGANGAHDLTKSNLNAFGRTYMVTNGMGKMPAFGKTLSPAQVQQVVAYSLTLR
ncbi:c-type cytochrome [Hymenobacter humi]|uniref:C-type cytochrome n=1 Tax=Hymenobacter humi TaxID=1411620 RepID=A0ABW2U1D4_9BACT